MAMNLQQLLALVRAAVQRYDMLREGDRVAVCISGGKDSMLLAKLFQELQRHRKFAFELEFLVMDPGYHPKNREAIEHNARVLGIPITIFPVDLATVIKFKTWFSLYLSK